MDPVSQGVVGAALPKQQRSARRLPRWLVRALGGMAPIWMCCFSRRRPHLFLEFHRQFTHSLVFIPIGALLVFAVLRSIAIVSHASRPQCWTSLFGVSDGLCHPRLAGRLHVLRHATAVAVFQRRIAWDTMSIVDPLFTVPLVYWLLQQAAANAFGFLG